MDRFRGCAHELDWRTGVLSTGVLSDDADGLVSQGATIGAIDPNGTDRKVAETFDGKYDGIVSEDGSPTAAEAAFMRSSGGRDGGGHKYPDVQAAPPKRIPFLIEGGLKDKLRSNGGLKDKLRSNGGQKDRQRSNGGQKDRLRSKGGLKDKLRSKGGIKDSN